MKIADAIGLDVLHAERRRAGGVGDGGALAVAPVHAAAYGAFGIVIEHLAGKRRLFAVFAYGKEGERFFAHAQVQCLGDAVEVFLADGEGVLEGDGV